MPRNNRVAKKLKPYNLRIEPIDYEILQKQAEANGIPMNTLLQKIIADFTKDKKITESGQVVFDKINSLPLEEQKAIIKKLSTND